MVTNKLTNATIARNKQIKQMQQMHQIHQMHQMQQTSNCNNQTRSTNKQTHPYRIPVSLLVLGPVAAVAEGLVAVVVRGELAQERLLSGVRPGQHCQHE